MDHAVDSEQVPTLSELQQTAARIGEHIHVTPTIRWPVPQLANGPDAELFVKLELLQVTGSFKPRGAINTIMHYFASNSSNQPYQGVTAFSAGNHAIATAYAARVLGVSAKVVMPRSANPFRIERCRDYGAEIVFGDTISDLLQLTQQIQQDENRLLVHPFEGIHTIMGTATVGLELCADVPQLDAVIVPVGGGGLIAGIATAVKHLQPNCQIIGVEPENACGMQQSLQQDRPMKEVAVNTIADSLGAPMHTPLSFSLVRRFVDRLVKVSDVQMQEAMRQMFLDVKLAAEPACAAALAAFNGPLSGELTGRRVALIACGSNIDQGTYQSLSS
ncbi:MAG: pyridoxal-phosphate dependent enzyme [Granulosicoccus sp.]|nr:pyridoxal-phosphate dependent enzyme [Granulosicoccus sp.]